MAQILREEVTAVHHWTDRLFSFRTTRSPSFRFRSGHFTMIGLEQAGKPLMRAYSMASANYDDELEFFSIKVPEGPLTSKLQNIRVGDELLVNSKSTGTLVPENLLPGRNLYLIATGTGLAPFLSLIRDPEVYEGYERVILTHGCRYSEELAYRELITEHLPSNEYLGEEVREKLVYYPTVTREDFVNRGRLTDLLRSGKLPADIGLPPVDPASDRFMICGSPSMLKELCGWLDERGFVEARHGDAGHYVVERAFVES
tara:strand:+ start:7418 stop:8191 length:774 start_codon:yes stop_codon:yes gene_type:complete